MGVFFNANELKRMEKQGGFEVGVVALVDIFRQGMPVLAQLLKQLLPPTQSTQKRLEI